MNKTAKTILSVSIIVLVAVLVYFFVARKTNVFNETVNWEVYRNEEYGIEFKYPKGWYIYDMVYRRNGISIYDIPAYEYEHRARLGWPEGLDVTRSMHIYRHENETVDVRTYAEQAYADQKTLYLIDHDNEFDTGLLKKEQGYITVAQTQSYQIYTKIINRDGGPQECYDPPCDWSSYKNIENLDVSTYVPHISGIFEVSLIMSGEISNDAQKKRINLQEETSNLNTYKLILSTFKFLN